MLDLESARAELKKLLRSWDYAFAMGHGCSIGALPESSRAVLIRVKNLTAIIEEHRT